VDRPAAAKNTKIAIVGTGHVGSAIAYAALIRGSAQTIALYGRNAEKVRAGVLDLRHGLPFVPAATVIGSDDVETVRDADVIVLAVGGTPRPRQTRLDLAEDTVAIVADLLPRLTAVAPGAVVLAVTNPVDVITYAAWKLLGLPRERVMGTGTVLDGARFRSLIAQHFDVAARAVDAYVIGEHGESAIPVWSSASIGSVPVLDWHDAGHPRLTPVERDDITRRVISVGLEILHAKGHTDHAVALAAVRIAEAVLRDENQVLSVSSVLSGYAGIRDEVALSAPAVINRSGVQRVLPVPLSVEESEGLYRSADAIRTVIDKLGL
jgi:L-lactate dehydrogenase